MDRADADSRVESLLVDDRTLVKACLDGDPEAWKFVILRYQRLICSIHIRARFSPVNAADIFQSVCLKLFEKLASLRKQEHISSWLMTTTIRECWRVVENRRRETQAPIYDDDNERDIGSHRLLRGASRRAARAFQNKSLSGTHSIRAVSNQEARQRQSA